MRTYWVAQKNAVQNSFMPYVPIWSNCNEVCIGPYDQLVNRDKADLEGRTHPDTHKYHPENTHIRSHA